MGAPPHLSTRLDLAVTDLPTRWLQRQLYGRSPPAPLDTDVDELLGEALEQQFLLGALARIEDERPAADTVAARLDALMEEEFQRVRIPLTLVATGVAGRYTRRVGATPQAAGPHLTPVDPADTWAPSFENRPDHLIERAVVEFSAAHRAIASTGVGLMLPQVPQSAFHVLWQLEDHFHRSRKPAPRKVARLLARLDEACRPLKNEAWGASIPRASRITAFTNFPIGLLRLQETGDPLCCSTPIAYRPLLPLTRSLQQEVAPSPSIDFSDGFRILIAECISPDDGVGEVSRLGWDAAVELVETSGAPVTITHVDVASPEVLRKRINQHEPHVLVLSAHGHYAPSSNVAGVMIGETFCLGPELGPMPPVVLLSACTVAPRGQGAVTVADLLIREGAEAVLGTQIPVDVGRNAILMGRFLVYLLESVSRREPEVSLLDVWQRVAATNAVNDILSGNKRLMQWAKARKGGAPVLQEFMDVRSRGRLRRGHIYEDTEAILGEMADERGQGPEVRNWLRNPGYVPETIFYSFIGRPDRINLREPIDLPARAWEEIRAARHSTDSGDK